jgi:hypothetical protein
MESRARRRGLGTRAGRPAGRPAIAKGRTARAADRSSAVVTETLAAYAERGIFRAFGDRPSRNGRFQYSFRWHTEIPLNVTYDPLRRELVFCDILPAVGSRSAMSRDLHAFVEGSSSPALPAHRRIDRRRMRAALAHRGRSVSLVVVLEHAHLEYGVRRAVNLVHELFVQFLRQPMYFQYMVDHFGADPDM